MKIPQLDNTFRSVAGSTAVFIKDDGLYSVTLKSYGNNQWYIESMIGTWLITEDNQIGEGFLIGSDEQTVGYMGEDC